MRQGKTSRSKARKRAIDVLFEADQRFLTQDGYDSLPSVITVVLGERISSPMAESSMPEYGVQLVEGVIEHVGAIDEWLETYSHGWSVARMPAVDRAILRMAAWELVYQDDVPDAVVQDEATQLAQELSTDESPTFINGLLARLAQMKSILVIEAP